MIYRDATLIDLPFIVDIYNSTIASRMVTADTVPVSLENKIAWFNGHVPGKRPLLVIEDEKHKKLGWVSIEPFLNRPAYHATAEISIYLEKGERGKGIGTKALEYIIERAKSYEIQVLLGYIFAHNIPSLQLFYKLHFRDWALLPDVAILDEVKRSLKIVGRKLTD